MLSWDKCLCIFTFVKNTCSSLGICHCLSLRTELRGQKRRRKFNHWTFLEVRLRSEWSTATSGFGFHLILSKGKWREETLRDFYSKTRLLLFCEGHVKTSGTATRVQSKGLSEITGCVTASGREGRQDLATPGNFSCVNSELG